MAQTKAILLVNANQHENRALFSALVRAGHTVTDTARVDYAIELLADRSFEVAIVDLLSAGSQMDGLFQKLAEDWSDPLIIGIADFALLVAQQASVPRGAHVFMAKPVEIPRLVHCISAYKSAASYPNGTDVVDYLRCLIETGQNAQLEVIDRHGNLCKLFVADRALIHAACGKIQGDQALFQVLTREGGYFSHVPWCNPDMVSIREPLENLLSRTEVRGNASGAHSGIPDQTRHQGKVPSSS